MAMNCPKDSYSVTSHFRSDYTKQNGKYVQRVEVKEYCRQYAPSLPLKTIFNGKMPEQWPNKDEKFKPWTEKEIEEIESILKKLPKALTEIGDLQLYRAYKSKWPKNSATILTPFKIITFYDNAVSDGTKRILIHELSHILWENISRNNREQYLSVAEWNLNQNGEAFNSRSVVSEKDGRSSPDEDFSNNVEYLIVDKNYKKVISIEVENCLKNILGIKK